MLPAAKSHRFSLADVLPNSFAALRGERGALGLPPVRHAVIVLADGLGAANLVARAGHARRMLAASSSETIGSGFPTTTASALATFATGADAGRHGLVGYRVLEPESDRVVTLLSAWEVDGLDPDTWQRLPTIFEQTSRDGVSSFAIGSERYAESGFTAAVLRGAEYLVGVTLADRFAQARSAMARSDRSLSYLYFPGLDVAGHRSGWGSPAWTAVLEEFDEAVAEFAATLKSDEGMLLTADHGMVDVPPESHVLIDPLLLDGVRHIAGEPRCLQLYTEPGRPSSEVADAWRRAEGHRAWIATREEAIAAGWFGRVDPEVAPRIGDVLIAARKRYAYYADPADPARRMVGQHGSLTTEELAVPLLRFGAFRRG
jgi:hypothetical protein